MNYVDLIEKYEGYRSQAYKCPAGVWTIGIGSTFYENGMPVKEGDTITRLRAERTLEWYVGKEIMPAIKNIPTQFTQGQIAALVSLIYNWGVVNFLKSNLQTALITKNWGRVYKEWDIGVNQGFNGLLKRRSEELFLFMKDIK